MRESHPWSLGLGRWLGVPVRLHTSFVVLALFVFYLTSQQSGLWPLGLLCLVIWFACVLLHEAGHAIAIARLGGVTERVVLTPLGGLSEGTSFFDPQRQIVSAMAGMLANLAAWLAAACILAALGEVSLTGLLNPFYPQDLFGDSQPLIVVVKLGYWLNWLIVVVNLLPTTATDGGRVLRATLALTWDQVRAQAVVRRASYLTVVVLCLLAWFLRDPPPEVLLPAWVPLLAVCIFLAFHAAAAPEISEDEALEDELFGYDFSQGYTSLERRADAPEPPKKSALQRWIENRRQARDERRKQVEVEEEGRVDEILARLHEQGMDAISADDRALLHRVSARYRSRAHD